MMQPDKFIATRVLELRADPRGVTFVQHQDVSLYIQALTDCIGELYRELTMPSCPLGVRGCNCVERGAPCAVDGAHGEATPHPKQSETVAAPLYVHPHGPKCARCGGPVEKARWVYAIPTCYSCLPAPPPIPVITASDLCRVEPITEPVSEPQPSPVRPIELEREAARQDELRKAIDRGVYMVNVNCAGSVFVKSLDFFSSQGGFSEEWGTHWVPMVADSIEDAREKGCALPGARPFERQAK